MNEELDSQLSAMFDDELPDAECQLLARRLSRDDLLQARWGRYAAIGAAIRAEKGIRLGVPFAREVRAALSSEPALLGSELGVRRGGGMIPSWWQPVAGVAVAAGVAALSILWLRGTVPEGVAPLLAASTAIVHGASPGPDSAASYVVPQAAEPRAIVPVTELANYVVAHSEFSTPVSRHSLLSALVASESGVAAPPDPAHVPAIRPKRFTDEAP